MQSNQPAPISRHEIMQLHNSIRQKASVTKNYLPTNKPSASTKKRAPQMVVLPQQAGKFERVQSIHAKMKRMKHAREKVLKREPSLLSDRNVFSSQQQ